jgi:hypothetical protein
MTHNVWHRVFPLAMAMTFPVLLAACTATRHMVIASTATSIGVEISQNPANQSPQAKLGYQRAEVALVPTNRSAGEEPGSVGCGAAQLGDVIMEIRYGGIFDTGKSSGIYQRLAVGHTAVQQPGASLMFARDAEGAVDPDAAGALRALQSVPARDTALKGRIAAIARLRGCHPEEVDKAIAEAGVGTFNDLAEYKVTEGQLNTIEEKVSALEPCA